MINGEWKEVDGKYKALPHTILPNVMKKDALEYKYGEKIN